MYILYEINMYIQIGILCTLYEFSNKIRNVFVKKSDSIARNLCP